MAAGKEASLVGESDTEQKDAQKPMLMHALAYTPQTSSKAKAILPASKPVTCIRIRTRIRIVIPAINHILRRLSIPNTLCPAQQAGAPPTPRACTVDTPDMLALQQLKHPAPLVWQARALVK